MFPEKLSRDFLHGPIMGRCESYLFGSNEIVSNANSTLEAAAASDE